MKYKIFEYSFRGDGYLMGQEPSKLSLESNDFELFTFSDSFNKIVLDKKFITYTFLEKYRLVNIDYELYSFVWDEENSNFDITKFKEVRIQKRDKNGLVIAQVTIPIDNKFRKIAFRNKKLSNIYGI